ncbi:phage tail protein [Sphingomonas bacterium]|uniref:GTA baseplate fiber-binding domain-containing protein n=1 Tax=Sphingomonas bacterium TaxID=1895847 RepID=UPI001575E834|nr:phage tail protein [Sphingomonas bacterium]
MATLLLTAVGGAIAGPFGAAIGALAGQYADNALIFRQPSRQGPRLTELALQTSSYGTQIPKLFGTMRVAGTVIWSTDLIESSATSHAKGQPSVTTYSYSASFAVLLSARPILSVGRIWADGNLLRGAAGDFKVATGFRLHPGGEDQAADPLIASAEDGLTPAHRGYAYALFEGLALGDYGNRIPSLTFEIVADAASVGIGTIAAAIAPEIVGGAGLPLVGFAVSGGSVRAVLDTLGTAGGAWFAADGARLTMRDAAVDPVPIADAGYAATARGERRARQVAAIETVPRTVTLSHYDPARDYQTGVQRASRPGAGALDDRVEMPAVLAAADAKAMATAILARAETARTKRTVTVQHDAMVLGPGDPVTISGEDGIWRIATSTIEAMVTKLDLVPVNIAPHSSTASSGRVSAAADRMVGRTTLAVFETPALDDAILTQPRISIAAAGAGAGWRGAPIAYSIDDGASWIDAGSTAAPAIIGTLETVPAAAPATLFDRWGSLIVRLASDAAVLADADGPALDRGANLALAGAELLQFGTAEPLGDDRWRLSRLSRGRRGTEAAIGTQVVGDPFVLLTASGIRAIDLPLARIGGAVRVMATGVGDGDGVVATAILTGRSILPPAPVHLTTTIGADGTTTIAWVRRSRAGWRWIDGVDAPIGEEAEAYRSTLTDAAGAVRTIDTDRSTIVVAAADIGPRPVRVTVRQRGDFGASDAATIVLA